MNYEEPKLDIIRMEAETIICTSIPDEDEGPIGQSLWD